MAEVYRLWYMVFLVEPRPCLRGWSDRPLSVHFISGANDLCPSGAHVRAVWGRGRVLGAGGVASSMGQCLLERLDQIVAELAHLNSPFRARPYPPPPGNGPSFMKAFSTLAVTRDALLSQALMGSAWPQAMELADHTAPSPGVVK